MSTDQRPMRSILLAVFGHYDSRGGTTGWPIADRTEAAVAKAFKEYNLELFGYDEAEEKPSNVNAGVGRTVDVMVADMLYPDGPAVDDFLYVAELHYEEGADLRGDLEEPDEQGRPRRVLKSGGEDDERAGWPSEWKLDTYQAEYGEATTNGSLIRESLKRPLQLELVTVKNPNLTYQFEKKSNLAAVVAEQIIKKIGVNYETKMYYWDNPEYKRFRGIADRTAEKFRVEREKAAVKAARVIADPKVTRWDDDAFGFVVRLGEGI